MNLSKILILVFGLCASASLFGHGDLHERIVLVTDEIKKSPDSAFLYFKRGKLYFQHDDYKSSIKDLLKSSDLGYFDIEQELLFAKNYYEIGFYNKALDKIDALLNDDPENVIFHKIKGRVYMKMQEYDLAALSFEAVIKFSSKTFPENYIECANAWVMVKSDDGYANAINILDLGIESLGSVISLYEEKVRLHSEKSEYDLAINSQKEIIQLLNRKEYALVILAELYFKNENIEAGLEALQNSKKQIDKLPNRIKNTQNIKDLISKIDELEASLN